jgi:hypothetical protein
LAPDFNRDQPSFDGSRASQGIDIIEYAPPPVRIFTFPETCRIIYTPNGDGPQGRSQKAPDAGEFGGAAAGLGGGWAHSRLSQPVRQWTYEL